METAQCKVSFNGIVQNPSFLQQSVSQVQESTQTQTLWAAHGGCAAVAWGILVPLAIGSSIIRETLESIGLPNGVWFQIHRGLNTIAALLTICAFGIAVHLINEAGKEHFTGGTHLTLGLVIFILTLLQALNGILRPHLPPAVDSTSATNKEVDEEGAEEDAVNGEKEEAPSEPKSQKRVLWEYGHRILGAAVLAMAWWQVQSGFGLFASFFVTDLRGAFWGVVGAITAVVVLVKIYQVMRKSN